MPIDLKVLGPQPKLRVRTAGTGHAERQYNRISHSETRGMSFWIKHTRVAGTPDTIVSSIVNCSSAVTVDRRESNLLGTHQHPGPLRVRRLMHVGTDQWNVSPVSS